MDILKEAGLKLINVNIQEIGGNAGKLVNITEKEYEDIVSISYGNRERDIMPYALWADSNFQGAVLIEQNSGVLDKLQFDMLLKKQYNK